MERTMRRGRATSIKFGLAALAAAALAFGAASPAFAADIQLGPDDIAGYEVGGVGTEPGFNYNTWHIGSVSAPAGVGTPVTDSLSFGECNVTVLAPPAVSGQSVTQVLSGFNPPVIPGNQRPTTEFTGDVSELQALIDTISIDVASGTVTLQLPVFLYLDGDTGTTPDFTTFRNAAGLGPGVHTLTADTALNNSTGGPVWPAPGTSVADTLAFMQADVTTFGDIFQILGVGFTGSPGTVVNSISFGGNTYFFGTGSCAPLAPTPPGSVQTAAPAAVEATAK